MRAFADSHGTGTSFRRQRPGLIRVDATSPDAVWHALDQTRPGIVVNCVGERHARVRTEEPARAHELNVDVARLIAEATRAYGARLLHISSDYVFDGIAPPYRPHSRCRPQGFHGRLKLLSEDMVRAVHPEVVILRLPMLYGPVENVAESDITEIAQEVRRWRSRWSTVGAYEGSSSSPGGQCQASAGRTNRTARSRPRTGSHGCSRTKAPSGVGTRSLSGGLWLPALVQTLANLVSSQLAKPCRTSRAYASLASCPRRPTTSWPGSRQAGVPRYGVRG
ncbi:sugar nucleotide-binding protein [Streptomyces sp. NPDC006658]|uniref:sugar nucleotide-binding protein n=1 Tax=Streptomyces sp. NPDC006658 TaxID=3156900 RepID=UPI0033E227D3